MDAPAGLWLFCLYLQVFFSTGVSNEWDADIVPKITALTDSCVVIPCTFKYPGTQKSSSQQRAIWFKKKDHKARIYDEDQSKVEDSFKGRTKLVGELGKLNCSLEIDDIRDHDNDHYCFRTEIPSHDQYSFKESCVLIATSGDANVPRLTHHRDPVIGSPFTVTCSIIHTCPSHVPSLTWSRGTKENVIVDHKDIHNGNWETLSILTFIPMEEDDHTEVSCMVSYHGRTPVQNTFTVYLKRKASLLYIIVPVTVAVGTSIVFGGLCLLMRKKYKRRIEDLQSRGDKGVWSRLSRMTRRRQPTNNQDGPSRPERSIWTRFSGRPHGNNANMTAGYWPNIETTAGGGQNLSKPRCPSPTSSPKFVHVAKLGNHTGYNDNDDYINTADINIYGNMS